MIMRICLRPPGDMKLATVAHRSLRVVNATSYFRRYATVTNDNNTASTAALVAIDIAKAKNDKVIERPGKHHRQRMKVLNTRAGTFLRFHTKRKEGGRHPDPSPSYVSGVPLIGNCRECCEDRYHIAPGPIFGNRSLPPPPPLLGAYRVRKVRKVCRDLPHPARLTNRNT